MHKNLLFLFFIILVSNGLFAQDWNEIYYLEGEAQYLVEEKNYDKAIDIYRKMIREIPDYSYAKYKIGLLYLRTDDQKNRAIEYLEEASKDIALDFDEKSLREIRTPVDVLIYLGEAYQIANRIDEAIVVYNKYKGLIKPESEDYSIVLHRLKACENAKQAIQNPSRVLRTNIGAPVNNDDSNFGAVISGDGNTLIFTSYTRNYLDNYYSVKQNGVWTTPKRISEKLSSKYYLKTVSLSFDGSQLYLATDDPEKNDIFVCYKEGKEWLNAEKLPKTINGKKSNETHASVSKDGKTLYFTSDREGGLGGVDIYKSTLNAKGSWGEAENMGPVINTEFDEATPFITLDDKYLFYSSQGHNSIGGFDIFYVDLTNPTNTVHLAYPANTTGDNVFFVPDNSLTSGYLSEYDSTSLGKKDIYYLSILPKITLAGDVKNSLNGEKITTSDFEISILETNTNNFVKSISSNNGHFEFEINPGNYSVLISNENYNSFSSQINIPQDYTNLTFPFEALIEPIENVQEELVAEIAEEPAVDTKKNEEPVTQPKEVLVEETTKEEIKTIPRKEDIPEPIVKDKTPKKEIEKFVPNTTTGSELKTYSVQLMALKNPVEVDYFKNVDNVRLAKYPDGYYRYTVGNTGSYSEAQKLMAKIHEIGYKDAFIRINESGFVASPSNSVYTIQLMALIIPVTPEYFKGLSSVEVIKGNDDYFRYTIGKYNSYELAKNELQNIKNLGYKQAFIKKIN